MFRLRLYIKRLLTSRHFKPVRLLAAASILTVFVQLSTFSPKQPEPFAHRPSITAQDLRPHISSVFIASVQYNSEDILRAHWIPNLLKLLNELQTANITVYVSIYENHSLDGTKSALSELARTLKNLNINHTIDLDTEARASVIEKSISSPSGWLETRYGKELRRIVYLAGVRNRALKPLQSLGKDGVKFDKILFTNDIFYSVPCLDLPRDGQTANIYSRSRMRSRFCTPEMAVTRRPAH